MLKECVKLIDMASAAQEVIGYLGDESESENDYTGFCEKLQVAIDSLIEAIGNQDEQNKSTDAAINLLFRAVVTAENEPGDADGLVLRAEKLLGFVPLKSN